MDNKVSFEIGSEFSMDDRFNTEKVHQKFDQGIRTYSGRMALYGAVQDCKKERSLRRAWLPSYCCESMVQPFRLAGLSVSFYGVNFDKESNKIIRSPFEPEERDLVLSMSYFGFEDEGNDQLLKQCRDRGVATIEDRTHSLLINREETIADYTAASLRKWFPMASGGWLVKKSGSMQAELCDPEKEIVEKRKAAMAQKAAYLSGKGNTQMKQAYSQMYQACNRSFGDMLPLRSMDEWSLSLLRHLDLEAIRNQRRKNAQVLVQSLQEAKGITLLFTTVKEQDCPLFVPIFASDARSIQSELALKNIYCPMHWPRHCEEAESNLYETEISLICDQRYDEEDMRCIVQALQK